MSRLQPMLRLFPQAAGEMHEQLIKVTTELNEVTRFRKEFDQQLAAAIGYDAMRKLHRNTKQALLLADLVKEAA